MHSQACCAKILLSTLGRNILTLCRATMHIFRACMISREFSHGRFLSSFKVNWNVSQFCLNWERLELTILWREAKTNLHRKQNYTTQDENYRKTSLDLPEDCNWSSAIFALVIFKMSWSLTCQVFVPNKSGRFLAFLAIILTTILTRTQEDVFSWRWPHEFESHIIAWLFRR